MNVQHTFRMIARLLVKQISAAIFGILLLIAILLSFKFYPDSALVPRYDFLFLLALLIQLGLIKFGFETWREARVILVFHIVGTLMELFKTQMGSWSYPEANFIRIAGVPLFSGFMYAAVGSYMARSWRFHNLRFDNYPPFSATLILGIGIYANFYAHHFTFDMRYVLFLLSVLIFYKCWARMEIASNNEGQSTQISVPILGIFCAIAGLIYLAENLATYGRAWVYPSQENAWQMVPLAKFGSWYLLMLISWVLVSALRLKDLKYADKT